MHPEDLVSESDYQRAVEAGAAALQTEPVATLVYYDSMSKRITLVLRTGDVAFVPREKLWEIPEATDEQLSNLELMPTGTAVHWPLLDADYGVATLLGRGASNYVWKLEAFPVFLDSKTVAR